MWGLALVLLLRCCGCECLLTGRGWCDCACRHHTGESLSWSCVCSCEAIERKCFMSLSVVGVQCLAARSQLQPASCNSLRRLLL